MLCSDKSAYCEFLALQGHRVVQTPGSVWVNIRPKVFQPAPPFYSHPEQAGEARQALREAGGLVGRWFTPVQESPGANPTKRQTSAYILRPPYDLSRIQSKARNQTRRGLERVQVRCVTFAADIERQAFPVYTDNVQRLGLFRNCEQLKRRWEQWVNALAKSRCSEFWGAWEGNRLVAFSVVVFSPWGVEIVCQRSLASALELYPNNALVFSVASSVFQRGAALLSYGLGEFGSSEGGLDHFKRGMAFEEQRMEEHFCCHPAVRFLDPILTAERFRALGRAMSRLKKSPAVSKVATRLDSIPVAGK